MRTQRRPARFSRTELVDLATVIKVSQAVSGEIVLEKLVDRLMRAALEQAGAERGLLIDVRRDRLQVEAVATTTERGVTVKQWTESDAAPPLPESLVRYVMRTHESVILDDATNQHSYPEDAYINEHRPRSMLTLPLLNQGKLIRILYLENNLAPYVFTSDRITVLKVLASQRALEDRERKIRRLVDANVVGIFLWDIDGAIHEANDAFLHMLQYDREDVARGRIRWTELTPPEWRAHDEAALATIKARGRLEGYEKEYFRKDGSRVPVLLAAALFDEGGRQGVAFAVDLSEQKRRRRHYGTARVILHRRSGWHTSEVGRGRAQAEKCSMRPRNGTGSMASILNTAYRLGNSGYSAFTLRIGNDTRA